MRTAFIFLFSFFFAVAGAQQVIIKGTLRCMNNTAASTKGAVNIVIIPSFNPRAAVASITTPQGFFQISTGWNAKELRDKEVTLYILTKCNSCKKIQRVFISEDLDKRNTDAGKLYVTVRNWKLLENCKETELPDLLSEKLLDSARRLPAMDINGKAPGSPVLAPVSFINLFEKLVTFTATQKDGTYRAAVIPEGKIKYGRFLHTSPLSNTDNTGFNFSPNRNLSEAVFWNAAAIAFSSKPDNVSLMANYKNNIKLSAYQQLAPRLYIGAGGIYTKQDQFRFMTFSKPDTANVNHPEKLQEFAAFIAPVYLITDQLSVGVTVKSVWQQFNNPLFLVKTSFNSIPYNFQIDSAVKKQFIDADISVNGKINSFMQVGISVMNITGAKLYADMFVADSAKPTYVNQRSYGAGICFKRRRFNAGVDVLLTDKGFYDASAGVNFVPFNDALIAAGYAFKQKSYSVSFRLKHFKIAYINDNDLVVNEVKIAKNKLFDGRIYSGFVFDF